MLLFALAALTVAPPLWLGEAPPKAMRIVSLAPSATEIIFALGEGARVVGVTRFDTFPPAVLALPQVGGFNDPDPEAVLTLTPDLVVAVPTSGGRGRLDLMARFGVPVLVLPAQSLDDLFVAIAALGSALDRSAQAESLAQRLRGELSALQQAYAGKAPARVLVAVGRRPLIAAGPGTFLDALLPYIAAHNVVRRGGAYPQLDLEALITLDPDVIIDATMGEEASAAFWKPLTRVRAVAKGRLVPVPDDTLIRPGPRLGEGLRKLARAVHGER